MKKLIIITAFAFTSLAANASLSTPCRLQMDEVIETSRAIEGDVASGLISEADKSVLVEMNYNVAKVVALTCTGIKKIELQKSVGGRVGLISHEKAQTLADKTYKEAMNYYMAAVK